MQKNNATLIVHLQTLRHNLHTMRSLLQQQTGVIAVVKANAYGHGAVRLATEIAAQVQGFAVNDLQEALALRKADITKPILVFGPPQAKEAHLYKTHDVTATVSSLHHLEVLAPGTRFHLNINTGMHRLGIQPREIAAFKEKRLAFNQLLCSGVYSHFATADEPHHPKIADQRRVFERCLAELDVDANSCTVHINNTGGTKNSPDSAYTAVRLGIGLYGYAPGNTNIEGLEPVMHWKSRLVQIHEIAEGASVSYGARWQAPSDGYIGVVPVGYEDGVPRGLTNQFKMAIGDCWYPVVGMVTMNYCMLFLGDKPVPENTEVTLWNSAYGAAQWAAKLQTIPYEMLCRPLRSIPRQYV